MQNKLKKPVVIVAFVTSGILALQVPFTRLLGANVRFTLFDFFAPIAGGVFGSLAGAGTIFLVNLGNFLIHGAKLSVASLIRFFPALFAAWYFGSKKHTAIIISALAMLAFNLHPIGKTVWFYSLFWVIPLVMSYWKNKSLLARSLGATFTAHAVGGAAWIWAFNLPANVWISLIPIVILERSLFTVGIAASFVFVKQALKYLKTSSVSTTNTLISSD